ncbi:bifunctional diaminohydroxyphosphoribosylaminopyrimidine deaminase/5-amino-6-(5-phosphoribosylamino)uracil reductase RibD [Thalassotalea sp. ND16A]|uniref:bifunctional diaminohydroxyphosphoribosylaminopyrimidine deaminase/5-amino-6-(5-phosphoribosylamino)uracil reductase RibD n=1 Tax=Thalassotalea sp. ND16A TaxID=1535422 RepID=UPI00068B2EB0|nr:bifunctional diaminohydroxyphosphoribosylaminopyrimidine deaminase/5-amino-6-(5-phosphoribosylamino)uracil reductase RibD [Thalassotalea sp. ND16A]
MQRAIALAKKGEYTTSPNPAVGCVLVKDDQMIGEGWHQKAGEGHAEVNALKAAGSNAKGATAYVTLEPCSHFGRTPPCAKGLIEAGVSHVVIAMQDPNPLVSGRGIKMLEDAGISTKVAVLEQAAMALNPGFIKRMQTGMPLVRCKVAASLDGKTAMSNGESKWITGSEARQDVQRYRAKSCAIISGADTVITDNANLNVRYQELGFAVNDIEEQQVRQPVRVIIDTQNRLTPELALFNQHTSIILVRTALEKCHQWPHFVKQLVVKKSRVAEHKGKADLTELVAKLAEMGFNNLWLESGARLAGAFLQSGLVDELVMYQAPKLMGENALGLFDIKSLNHLVDAIELEIQDIRMIGKDIRIISNVENTNKIQRH